MWRARAESMAGLTRGASRRESVATKRRACEGAEHVPGSIGESFLQSALRHHRSQPGEPFRWRATFVPPRVLQLSVPRTRARSLRRAQHPPRRPRPRGARRPLRLRPLSRTIARARPDVPRDDAGHPLSPLTSAARHPASPFGAGPRAPRCSPRKPPPARSPRPPTARARRRGRPARAPRASAARPPPRRPLLRPRATSSRVLSSSRTCPPPSSTKTASSA